jgi:hypothetical protein
MARTREQIQQDYQTACMYMGEKVNQISLLNKDIRLLQANIKKLNKEMQELMQTPTPAAPEVKDVAAPDTQQS